MEKNIKMEKFEYIYNGAKISIQVGKLYDDALKQYSFYAYSNFKRTNAISDSKEKAIEECIRRIKFKDMILNGTLKLMKRQEAEEIGKKAFFMHFDDKTDFRKIADMLSNDFYVQDNILNINVNYHESVSYEESRNKMPEVLAMIFVDLITGACEVLINRELEARLL